MFTVSFGIHCSILITIRQFCFKVTTKTKSKRIYCSNLNNCRSFLRIKLLIMLLFFCFRWMWLKMRKKSCPHTAATVTCLPNPHLNPTQHQCTLYRLPNASSTPPPPWTTYPVKRTWSCATTTSGRVVSPPSGHRSPHHQILHCVVHPAHPQRHHRKTSGARWPPKSSGSSKRSCWPRWRTTRWRSPSKRVLNGKDSSGIDQIPPDLPRICVDDREDMDCIVLLTNVITLMCCWQTRSFCFIRVGLKLTPGSLLKRPLFSSFTSKH